MKEKFSDKVALFEATMNEIAGQGFFASFMARVDSHEGFIISEQIIGVAHIPNNRSLIRPGVVALIDVLGIVERIKSYPANDSIPILHIDLEIKREDWCLLNAPRTKIVRSNGLTVHFCLLIKFDAVFQENQFKLKKS